MKFQQKEVKMGLAETIYKKYDCETAFVLDCGHRVENGEKFYGKYPSVESISYGLFANRVCSRCIEYFDMFTPKVVDKIVGTSKVPNFLLIPCHTLISLANRFSKGLISYKDKSWNALSPNFEKALEEEEWILDRANHIIDHTLKWVAKFKGKMEDDGDDDAGAILFGGSLLAEVSNHRKLKKEKEKDNKQQYKELTSAFHNYVLDCGHSVDATFTYKMNLTTGIITESLIVMQT